MKFSFEAPAEESRIIPVRSNIWTPQSANRDKIARFRAAIRAEKERGGPKAAIAMIRKIAFNDLYYLAQEILLYRDLYEPLHGDYCDYLGYTEKNNKGSLSLIPRSHYKSTIATIARSIWWIIRDPNVTIGLGSATQTNSKKFLKEIRNHLESGRLHAIWPEIFYKRPKIESPKWTETEIITKRTTVAKEPTIKAFGVENNIPTGDHYKKLLLDDVVDQETIANEERIMKIKSQLKYIRPLRITLSDPIHYVGTRYHPLDPYGEMVESSDYLIYLRKAIENGVPIFPTKFPLEALEKEREILGSYVFSCQYMMEPVEAGDQKFSLDWLTYHEGIAPQAGYLPIAVCDPANKRKKKSDFTAILVFLVRWDGKVFWVDGVHDKLTPQQRIDAVFELFDRWKFLTLGYETIGFQDTDRFWIEKEMGKRRKYFRIVEINSHQGSKEDRIASLQPGFSRGEFIIPRQLEYVRKWENPDDGRGNVIDIVEIFKGQYSMFPFSSYDDLLDCFQMLRKVYSAPGMPKPTKPDPLRQFRPGAPKKKVYNPKLG